MDKAIQENKELQDEELYALLDKAWETERLCVSEELIQKTLKRVAEETDSKVVSFEAAKKRKLSSMKYAGVAVAAVFAVVLGVSVFGNGGILRNDKQMDAVVESTEKGLSMTACDNSETSVIKVNNGERWDGSRSGVEKDVESLADGSIRLETPEENVTDAPNVYEDEVEMTAMTVMLSREMAEALEGAGMASVSGEAECWEFVSGETDWEKELFTCLVAGNVWENFFPDDGNYRYVLEGGDGTRYVIEYNEPLNLIVRIKTEKGAFWGLLGAESLFFAE